jgi:hypothetical protein
VARVEKRGEHVAQHAWRLDRPKEHSPRTERARTVPLVLARGSARTLHLLLGVLRSRVEAALPARLFARAGVRAGPRSLGSLLYRRDGRCTQATLCARRKPEGAPPVLGPQGNKTPKSESRSAVPGKPSGTPTIFCLWQKAGTSVTSKTGAHCACAATALQPRHCTRVCGPGAPQPRILAEIDRE